MTQPNASIILLYWALERCGGLHGLLAMLERLNMGHSQKTIAAEWVSRGAAIDQPSLCRAITGILDKQYKFKPEITDELERLYGDLRSGGTTVSTDPPPATASPGPGVPRPVAPSFRELKPFVVGGSKTLRYITVENHRVPSRPVEKTCPRP